MKHQPSTLARNVSMMQCDTDNVREDIKIQDFQSDRFQKTRRAAAMETHSNAPRIHFTRSALFTALATSLVGFGMAPAALADTTNNVSSPKPPTSNQIAVDQSNSQPTSTQSTNTQSTTLSDDDTQLDIALDALRLKKAVEQGIIDQSVLDEYSEQSLGIKKSDAQDKSAKKPAAQSQGMANSQANAMDNMAGANDAQLDLSNSANDDLLQQAAAIQQQGYQMMTPEEIDRELAAMDMQNAQDIDDINNSTDVNSSNVNSTNINNNNNNNNNDISNNDRDFDAPIATLDDTTPPIGLDVDLDATNLPTPNNLETLGRNESAAERAQTAEVMSRPIDVSDSVSSGRVDGTGTFDNEIVANASDETNEDGTTSDIINPDDYLPDYQADSQGINQSIEQASKPKPMARNKGNIVKRLYNRLFNAGVMALPHVDTTIYLRQATAEGTVNGKPKLTKADNDVQPMKNIKAALDDTTVQSVTDFTAALPRLRQTALEAAQAVGYYDITLRLRQRNADTIDVIIEELGEPVRVDSRIVEIRGEGSEQPEYIALEKDLPPQVGDIFNHRVYKDSKAALESLSNTYGYFDQYWLNKSVDIILPDNTADVSLVYNTGDRYEFDDVVFFTYDEETNTLTQDPDKLPVELSLLQQLFDFKPGDPFYRPAVTEFSNDLSATRYFNTVNVESILPPDERSEASTLAFDNTPTNNSGTLDDDINSDGALDIAGNNGAESSAASNSSRVNQDNNADDGDENNAESEGNTTANSGETVNPADIAAIDFEADFFFFFLLFALCKIVSNSLLKLLFFVFIIFIYYSYYLFYNKIYIFIFNIYDNICNFFILNTSVIK